MNKQTFVLSILTAGFIAVPTFASQAQGCCSGMGAMSSGMDMSGHASSAAQPTAANKLPQPVATVFDHYSHIQTALASDSLAGVADNAQAIAQAVKSDTANTFQANIAEKAGALSQAADLAAARSSFKSLSQSLIEYSAKNPPVAGIYHHVHCSMADADWLQTDAVVNNPYLGKSMAHCGQFVQSSGTGDNQHQDHSMPGMNM